VTNSLQLVKQLARSGKYVAFTSELDAAPEIADGSLIFLPVRDKGAEPQTVGLAIDARRPLSQIARFVTEMLQTEITRCLADTLTHRSEKNEISEIGSPSSRSKSTHGVSSKKPIAPE